MYLFQFLSSSLQHIDHVFATVRRKGLPGITASQRWIAGVMHISCYTCIETAFNENADLFYKVLKVFAVIQNESTDINTICLLTGEAYDDFDTLRERLIECIPDFRLRLKLDPKSEQVVFAADVNSVFDIAWYTFARLLTEDPSLECLGSDGKRHGGIMICCHHCGQFFYRKAKHQQYCDRPECQKARNAKNQRVFLEKGNLMKKAERKRNVS